MSFLDDVPVASRFSDIIDSSRHAALPDEWFVGLADVVNSTAAIAAGHYKTVNMAGAAVIAGMANALGGRPFPFVFGGDGASFAVPAEDREVAQSTLAATAVLVSEEFGLILRTALVPVASIRSAGHDVRLAFFAASPDVIYAMFSGGGLAWADARMKAGEFAVPAAPAGSRPDLNGLSCRFEPMDNRRGVILSVIARPTAEADPARYRSVIVQILDLVDASPQMARPVPDKGPPSTWPPAGLDLEARLGRAAGASLWARRAVLMVRTALSHLVFRFGVRVGQFEPRRYIDQLVGNSDYRKFDDALRMTVDCRLDLADTIERLLQDAYEAGIVVYGSHRQTSALMTCFTPAVERGDHVHFIDGADGGYTAAAIAMKSRI